MHFTIYHKFIKSQYDATTKTSTIVIISGNGSVNGNHNYILSFAELERCQTREWHGNGKSGNTAVTVAVLPQ